MIAEESGKLTVELSRCRTKRELDALLRKIGHDERIPVDPERESYSEIGDKLGIAGAGDSFLVEAFASAIRRIRPPHR